VGAIQGFNVAIMRNWFIEKFPVFFRNVINYDGSLDFTVRNASDLASSETKKRFTKAKSLIQYFFKRLLKATTFNELPRQMTEFLDEFSSYGAPTEPQIFTNFERDRISLDDFNTLYNVNQNTKDFMRMYFMIGKALLLLTMLADDGFGNKLNAKSKLNIKVVSSVIYHSMMEKLEELITPRNEYETSSNSAYEPIKKHVFTKDQLAYMIQKAPKFYKE
jgi:hypothetical protein